MNTAKNDDEFVLAPGVPGQVLRTGLSRRTIMKGAAWTVPAMMMATSVPAYASSCSRGAMSTTGAARILSGTLLSTNLDPIVQLQGVHAAAPTPNDPDTAWSPLDVTALDTINVDLTGTAVALSQVLSVAAPGQVGTVNQYAFAESTGQSTGASGAVTNGGAIALNQNSPAIPEFGTLDLKQILQRLSGPTVAAVLAAAANLKLQIGAIAGRAFIDSSCNTATDDLVTRDYLVAHLRVLIESTLVSGLAGVIEAAAVNINVAGLAGLSVDTAVLINGAGSQTPQPLPAGADQPIQANLGTGVITVDVSTLLGNNAANNPFGASYSPWLNAQGANTVLFVDTPLPSGAVTAFMGGLIAGLEDRLLDAVTVTILGKTVTLRNALTLPVIGNIAQLVVDALNALFTSAGPVKDTLDAISTLLSNVFTLLRDVVQVTLNVQNTASVTPSGWPNVSTKQYEVAALSVDAVGLLNVLSLYLARGSVGPNTLL